MTKNRKLKTTAAKIWRGAFGVFFAAAVLLLFSSSAFAQKGTIVRKNVTFAKGTSSAAIKGAATWGASYVYMLHAKAGQRMTIQLTGKPSFDFSLVVPPEADGEQPAGETQGVKRWAGTLGDSGVYQIVVSHTIDGVTSAPFTLKVSIR